MTAKPDDLRSIDAALAEKVMGWHIDSIVAEVDDAIFYSEPQLWAVDWHPTTDIAQAFQVLEKLCEARRWFWSISKFTKAYAVYFGKGTADDLERFEFKGQLPEAICRAVLAALGGRTNE